MMNSDEKKLLVKIYTLNLRAIDDIQEGINTTVEQFLEQANRARENKGDRKIPEKLVFKTLENIEKLLAEINDEKFKHKFDERHYVEKRFAEMASRLRRIPTIDDMEGISISRAKIRHTHGNITKLAIYSQIKFATYFEYASEFRELCNEKMDKWIDKTVASNDLFSIFGITAAPVCKQSLKTVMNFHEKEGGLPIFISMCKRIEDIDQEIIDMFLEKKCILVLRDLELNNNIKIKYVNTNEKTMNPMKGFAKEDFSKSIIFAGIKQLLTPLAVKKGGHPRLHITTGSISVNHHRASINHNKNPHVSTIQKAESEHFMGGTLIEKVNNKYFIPTQIQFDGNKEFTLYGRKYGNNNLVLRKPITHVFGDIHEKEHAKNLMNHSFSVAKAMGIEEAVYHDLYDCASGSHWNDGRLMYKAHQYLVKESSWSSELKSVTDFLNSSTAIFKRNHIVDSNHDDMVLRALDKGNVFKEPENSFLAFLLAPTAIISFFEKEDTESNPIQIICERLGMDKKALLRKFGHLDKKESVLESAVDLFGIQKPERVNWMNLESKLDRAGFNMADHGHKSANGSKGSGQSFGNSFRKIWFGHTHSPYQENHIMGLGHNIDMRPGKRPKYAMGGTSTWMYADGFVNETGTSHHIFTIDGFRSRFLGLEALKQFENKRPMGLKKKDYPNLMGVKLAA